MLGFGQCHIEMYVTYSMIMREDTWNDRSGFIRLLPSSARGLTRKTALILV